MPIIPALRDRAQKSWKTFKVRVGDDSVDKVLAVQAWGPGFGSPPSMYRWGVEVHLVTPDWGEGRRRQVHPRSLLAGHCTIVEAPGSGEALFQKIEWRNRDEGLFTYAQTTQFKFILSCAVITHNSLDYRRCISKLTTVGLNRWLDGGSHKIIPH